MTMDVPTRFEVKSLPPIQKRPRYTTRSLAVLAVTASAFFLLGIIFDDLTGSPHDNENFQLFWDSWSILDQEFYYDLPDEKEMVYGAIQGLLSTSGDYYTLFVPPPSAELDRNQMEGEFGGIGAQVNQAEDGQFVVSSVLPGFPADDAGLKPNDVIEKVDGVSTPGSSLEEITSRIRGGPGTKVRLAIYRPSDETRFSATITRALIQLPTVFSELFDEVGYVYLVEFNDNATSILQEEIDDLLERGAQALILDLRGNPGGLLAQAVSVSDLFLDSGEVVKQRVRNGEETVYRSADGDTAEDIPLVVLIDGGSASASEVVAGALADRGRAVLIGQTSYGKGSVQHIHNMSDGSQLHVTVAEWFTPKETPIQGQGLSPDIEVEFAVDSVLDEDPFVTAALDYFREQGISGQ